MKKIYIITRKSKNGKIENKKKITLGLSQARDYCVEF